MVCPFLRQPRVGRIFNVGIVEPTDEFTPSNPPSNPELLNWLTTEFIKSGYDMKWLHRQITSSQAYQRSWRPNKTNAEDRRNYSRAIPRRIPAEVVYDAMKQVTAASDKLEAVRTNLKRRGTGHLSMRMAGTHAMKVFGKPDRATNCDCERVNEPTLLQSIFCRMIRWYACASLKAAGLMNWQRISPATGKRSSSRHGFERLIAIPPPLKRHGP